MRVSEIAIKGIQPFVNEIEFKFSPHITLIRGPNGVGKTTVIESIELLGHCPLMEVKPTNQVNLVDYAYVKYSVALTKADKIFLNSLVNGDTSINDFLLNGYPLELEQEVKDALNREKGSITENSRIEFYVVNLAKQVDDLKSYFKDQDEMAPKMRCAEDNQEGIKRDSDNDDKFESEKWNESRYQGLCFGKAANIKNPWSIRCEYGSADKVKLIKLLIAHGRPNQIGPRDAHKFSRSTRMEILTEKKGNDRNPIPGIVSYINTDMYDFGIGLDIRESPKNIDREMPLTIHNRFHFLANEDALENDKGGIDYIPIYNFDHVSMLWKNVFTKTNHLQKIENSNEPTILEEVGMRKSNNNSWVGTVHMRRQNKEMGSNSCKFMSSGENQILFTAMMMECLEAEGSVFLLDEPEIHVDISAVRNLYNHLASCSIDRENQFIIVSHLPFVFSQRLSYDISQPEATKNQIMGLMYISNSNMAPKYQDDAKKAIGESYAIELHAIQSQMRVFDRSISVIIVILGPLNLLFLGPLDFLFKKFRNIFKKEK